MSIQPESKLTVDTPSAGSGLYANDVPLMSAASTVPAMGEYLPMGEYTPIGEFAPVARAVEGNVWPPVSAAPDGTRPLKMIHLTAHVVSAGIESWLLGLLRNLDPQRVQLTKCVVANPALSQRDCRPFPIPVEVGGPELVERACRDCDVLLISDPGDVSHLIAQHRPRLSLFVAHGDGYWTRTLMERASGGFDHVIAVSQRVHDMVCQGFPTSVIMNGIDETRLSRTRSRDAVRRTLGFQPEDFVLGYVGRFSEEKNPFSVIDAVARLPSKFKALLVGFGHQRSQMLERANALIPGRYAFVQADKHLGDLYGAMDAFCLTSVSEGYGLAIMEAMMCGKPVIVSPVGFVSGGIEHRVNGIIVSGDAESVSDAARLLDQHPDWAASVGREAATYADRHGFASSMARQYEDLIWQLWHDRKAVPPRRMQLAATNP